MQGKMWTCCMLESSKSRRISEIKMLKHGTRHGRLIFRDAWVSFCSTFDGIRRLGGTIQCSQKVLPKMFFMYSVSVIWSLLSPEISNTFRTCQNAVGLLHFTNLQIFEWPSSSRVRAVEPTWFSVRQKTFDDKYFFIGAWIVGSELLFVWMHDRSTSESSSSWNIHGKMSAPHRELSELCTCLTPVLGSGSIELKYKFPWGSILWLNEQQTFGWPN